MSAETTTLDENARGLPLVIGSFTFSRLLFPLKILENSPLTIRYQLVTCRREPVP
jgi:hypothetical protein